MFDGEYSMKIRHKQQGVQQHKNQFDFVNLARAAAEIDYVYNFYTVSKRFWQCFCQKL